MSVSFATFLDNKGRTKDPTRSTKKVTYKHVPSLISRYRFIPKISYACTKVINYAETITFSTRVMRKEKTLL